MKKNEYDKFKFTYLISNNTNINILQIIKFKLNSSFK